MTGPVAQWGPSEDSPSGIAVASGSVWMAALRGQRLWRIPLDGAKVVADPQDFLVGRYGRLRSVLAIDDHTLLVTTSNRDGRQTPGAPAMTASSSSPSAEPVPAHPHQPPALSHGGDDRHRVG